MVKVRASVRSTVRTCARVGAKARCMTIEEGCAGQRAPHMTFRPGVGVGAVDRGRVRDRGRAPDEVGAWKKVGSGVPHEVRGRALSMARGRGGVAVRGFLGARERV